MRTFLQRTAVFLAVTALGSFADGTAKAQSPTSTRASYFPAPGYYQTTAGVVFVPTPGYYLAQPVGPRPVRSWWGNSSGVRPSKPHTGGGGDANNPPYYSSAVHSLHGRGHDSSRHGK